MFQLQNEVNAILDGGTAPEPVKPVDGEYELYSGYVEVIYDGSDGLALHNTPSWDNSTINGVVHGGVYTVIGRQLVDGVYMYKLKSGSWITSAKEYVEYRKELHGRRTNPNPVKPVYTVEQIAQEIVNGQGNWGNGNTRVQTITNAGVSYDAVQNRVNQLLGIQSGMSARQFALEVWTEGKHGSGQDRQNEARRLGVDYNEAQRLIGILANGGSI